MCYVLSPGLAHMTMVFLFASIAYRNMSKYENLKLFSHFHSFNFNLFFFFKSNFILFNNVTCLPSSLMVYFPSNLHLRMGWPLSPPFVRRFFLGFFSVLKPVQRCTGEQIDLWQNFSQRNNFSVVKIGKDHNMDLEIYWYSVFNQQ